MNTLRTAVTGLVILGLVALVGQTYADSMKVQAGVLKLAGQIKKGEKGDAAAVAKMAEGVEEVMEQFKDKKKGGIGVGTIEGIEKALIKIGRDAPTASFLAKSKGDLEEVGYIVAALADVTAAKPLAKAAKDKMWHEWSMQMREAGVKLAEAAKAGGAQDVKTAAAKINASCNACHSKYR